jgi:hypothetical protein
MVLERKFSWITNSHFDQWHKLHYYQCKELGVLKGRFSNLLRFIDILVIRIYEGD